MRGKTMLVCLVLPALMMLPAACAAAPPAEAAQQTVPTAPAQQAPETPTDETSSPVDPAAGPPTAPAPTGCKNEEETQMQLSINGQAVTVTWERNDATAALAELLAEGPLTVTAEPYGGFEVVGDLGRALPADDVQTTTAPGDIVLYTGDHIVVFHGSNTWAYTRLGHIEGLEADALRALLDGGAELTLTAV